MEWHRLILVEVLQRNLHGGAAPVGAEAEGARVLGLMMQCVCTLLTAFAPRGAAGLGGGSEGIRGGQGGGQGGPPDAEAFLVRLLTSLHRSSEPKLQIVYLVELRPLLRLLGAPRDLRLTRHLMHSHAHTPFTPQSCVACASSAGTSSGPGLLPVLLG
jgi:hypothetical protein